MQNNGTERRAFGRWLLELRTTRVLQRQGEVAAFIGVSRQVYGRMERGERAHLTTLEMRRLASAFGIKANEVLRRAMGAGY